MFSATKNYRLKCDARIYVYMYVVFIFILYKEACGAVANWIKDLNEKMLLCTKLLVLHITPKEIYMLHTQAMWSSSLKNLLPSIFLH